MKNPLLSVFDRYPIRGLSRLLRLGWEAKSEEHQRIEQSYRVSAYSFLPHAIARLTAGCACFVPEPGQNIHLPLSKKKQAGLEIVGLSCHNLCNPLDESFIEGVAFSASWCQIRDGVHLTSAAPNGI